MSTAPSSAEGHDQSGGLEEAPRRTPASRLARGCLPPVAVALFFVAVALLPPGTGATSLIVRAALGVGAGLVVVLFVRRALAAFVAPPPSSPPTVDARPAEVVYECAQCQTRVRLEVAATGKAPRHCGEEMVPMVLPGS